MSGNIYMQNILDHYHDPENYGVLDVFTNHVIEHNPLCGDKIEVFVVVENENLVDLKFQGEGCAISQAAMSILSSEIIGKSVSDILKIDKDYIVDLLGIELSPVRLKCALLSLQAVKNALGN